MQKILMKFDPATGEERPYPSHAAQWRNWHGVAAWLFDPWTGKRRNAYDVGSDVHGLLIVPAGTLGGDTGCGASKQNKHEAGKDAERYRRLCSLVAWGNFGVCRVQSNEEGDDYADDGDMLDAWLDDPEMIAEAQAIDAAMAGGENGN